MISFFTLPGSSMVSPVVGKKAGMPQKRNVSPVCRKIMERLVMLFLSSFGVKHYD